MMIASELKLPGGAVLKNRLAKSAMSEALADAHNNPGDAHIDLFARWGASGAALLIIGNTPIDRRHLEHAANFVLDEKTDPAQARKLAAAAKSGGAKVLAQLAHAGRQTPAAINPRPLSISDIRLDLPGYGPPRAADEKELRIIVGQFAAAAKLAEDAGFDGVEIHAAHGYLLSSALSPKINNRRDRWGGTLENRARLPLSAVRAVRAAVTDGFIVAVKLNSADFQKGGLTVQESAAVAVMLQNEKIDFLEISGGNFEAPVSYQHSPGTAAREGYFLESAREIKTALAIPVMVTGGFRTAAAMNQALDGGGADIIGVGRPFIIDPRFPARMLRGEINAAPAAERDFPPAAELPRGAGLNWFCHQLKIAAETGAADLSLPIVEGHKRYLADIENATKRFRSAG